ncbi:hypothetical protein OS493_010905 [Desmophyllum pertusum]|uniref:ATP-grasp domain-containing protein n=1 Tax=Desmophyllum pertusum TaxID=174260 RepID=A0A9W9ZFS7_9CNID|nr:hypothetical protein OS493_010905 [Desmophyllum pertusum]
MHHNNHVIRMNLLIRLIIVSSSTNMITIGSLIRKDLNRAYFLPQQPSSYSKGYRFQNDTKYRVFDSPPPALSFNQVLFPLRNLPTAGDEIPVIMDHKPPWYLQKHWQKWLPAFSEATVKSVDEALQDDVPIVTSAALQGIPEHKHSIDPDVMYKMQLKSSILDIGVPIPRHMDENAISYPCAVKADMGWCGRGSQLVQNASELSATLRDIRETCGWKGGIVFQEFLPGVEEVPSFQFHLDKAGEIFWVGTTLGMFDVFEWTGATVDWNKQDEYRDLVYEDFTVPIKTYLHKNGYFGLVTFEVLFTDRGKFLVDVNPRIGGDTTHLLLARYMASEVGLKHSAMFSENTHNMTRERLVEKANEINARNLGVGQIIILAAADVDNGSCYSDVSVFAETPDEVQAIFKKLAN